LSLSPDRARQLGVIGALRRHALHGSTELARQGQAGLRARLLNEIDQDGRLEDQERARRLQIALRAHMLQLALRSSTARRQRRLTEGTDGQVHGVRSVASHRAPSTSSAPMLTTLTGKGK
jgi:hypothetical protein